MKRLVALALALLVGTALVTTVGAALRPDPPRSSIALPGVTTTVTTAVDPAAPTATGGAAPGSSSVPPAGPVGYTVAELAAHATTADCWLAVGGNVYDVTTYLSDHPGGSRTIVGWCGREATEAFATEDGRGEHSPEAYALLAEYLLGPLTVG